MGAYREQYMRAYNTVRLQQGNLHNKGIYKMIHHITFQSQDGSMCTMFNHHQIEEWTKELTNELTIVEIIFLVYLQSIYN